MPDSREWASIIIVVAVVIMALAAPKLRKGLGEALRPLVEMAFRSRLTVLWLVYVSYATVLILGASQVGLWDPSMAWATVLIVLFGGLPLVGRFVSVRRSGTKRPMLGVVRDTFGLAAFIGAYVYLVPLPLGWEIVVQAALLVVGLVAAVEKRAQRLFLGFAVAVAVVGFVRTTGLFAEGMAKDEWMDFARLFALPFWFPVVLLPLLWGIGYYAATEVGACHVAASRLHHPSIRHRSKGRWMLTLALGMRLRLSHARTFVHPWTRLLADTTTRAERREVLAAFRRSAARTPT